MEWRQDPAFTLLNIPRGDRGGVKTNAPTYALKAVQKKHERDRTVSRVARHICVGSDGVCLHRDLFDYPLFDGGVKPAVTLPEKAATGVETGDGSYSAQSGRWRSAGIGMIRPRG